MENLSRPTPTSSSGEQIRAWIEWFGLARLVVSALAVVVVCVGAFWLVRTPPPPTEAALPRAVASSSPVASDSVRSSQGEQQSVSAITVHVAGAVMRPGVYQLQSNARVQDAINLAGGVTEDADLNALNLAAVVGDGVRVYVPVAGEVVPIVAGQGSDAAQDAPVIVDVNRANAQELQQLPGVGPATSAAIVAERDLGGPFIDVDDLQRVPGIGPAKVESLRGLVTT